MSTPTLPKRFTPLPLFALLCALLLAAGAVGFAPTRGKADTPPPPSLSSDATAKAQNAATWDAHTKPLLQTLLPSLPQRTKKEWRLPR